jgi:hypothetical protein
MPAPTKLTPELSAQILALARAGHFKATIASKLGIDRHSIDNWLKRGESEPGTVFEDFASMFRAIEAEFEMDSVSLIAASQKGHRGLMWLLERRFPERFARRLKTEVTGPNGGPIPLTVDPVALAARIEQLALGDAAPPSSGAADPDPGADVGGGSDGDRGGGDASGG